MIDDTIAGEGAVKFIYTFTSWSRLVILILEALDDATTTNAECLDANILLLTSFPVLLGAQVDGFAHGAFCCISPFSSHNFPSLLILFASIR